MIKSEVTKNYEGRKLFIGIDVHKRTYSIAVICEGVTVKTWRMEADPQKCVNGIKTYFKGAVISSVYEAGFSGYTLHRALISAGINNIVINPASVQKAANNRVKTDKLDATKMASQLSMGLLRGISVPSKERELEREITRLRSQLVGHRTTLVLQIKSKLMYYGIMAADDNRKASEKYMCEIENLDLDRELKFSLKILIDQWRYCSEKIKEVEKEISKQDQKNKECSRIYRSFPGVGTITSRILANELGNLEERFKNERELFSYTGLTPSEYSSGDTIRKGKISRCGPARIRWILIEVAWMCIRKDQSLKESYERIKLRRGGKKAIVAIARKLIGRIRSCFINNSLYIPQPKTATV